jgi:hypothetical protein
MVSIMGPMSRGWPLVGSACGKGFALPVSNGDRASGVARVVLTPCAKLPRHGGRAVTRCAQPRRGAVHTREGRVKSGSGRSGDRTRNGVTRATVSNRAAAPMAAPPKRKAEESNPELLHPSGFQDQSPPMQQCLPYWMARNFGPMRASAGLWWVRSWRFRGASTVKSK